jgi:FtsZ-binding cell division protein ZapB
MTDTSKEAIAEILDALDRILGEEIDVEVSAARKMIAAMEAERDEIEGENEALKSKVKALREENYQLWQARLRSETPNVATLFGVELGEVLDMVITQQEQQT